MENPTRSTLDERPICIVCVDAPPCRIVAPSLAGFLGLATIAGVEEIERDRSDARWREVRNERLENDADGEFRRVAELVCTLPGVTTAALARSRHGSAPRHHDRRRRRARARARHERTGDAARAHRARLEVEPRGRAERLLRQIETWLGISYVVHASNRRALESLLERLQPSLPNDVRDRLRAEGVRV